MADVMSRLGVGARIYIGFAAVLVLLGVVGWVGYDGLGRAGNGVSEYARVSNNTIFVVGMAGATQEMRRHVLNYAYTGSDKALKRIMELRGLIGQQLGEFEERTTNPPRKRLGGELRQLFQSYGTVLDQFFEAKQGRDRLVRERMDPVSRDLRVKYSEIMKAAMHDGDAGDAAAVGEAQEVVMLARIQILRMLNDPDPKLAEEAQARMAAAQRSVNELPARETGPARRKAAEEARTQFADFADAFEHVIAVNARFIHLIRETLPQIGDQFGQSIDALRLSQVGLNDDPDNFKGSQKATEEKTRDGVAAAQTSAIVFALAAFGLGLLLAWLIARSITRPVVAMTGTMTRLAAGDLGVGIPALGNQDEIGEMAQAVQVFKENAVEKKRMDEADRERVETERKAAETRRVREQEIGGEISALIEAVAKGDLTSRLGLADKDGFYRTMSEGINRLTDTVQAVIADLGQVLGALAEGDLDKRIVKDYQGAFEQIKTDVNATSAKLAEIMQQITEATGAISNAAAEVSAGSADLSERTEQQASSLEETAAAMEQVGATVRTSAENAQRANSMAADARGAAEQGGVVAGSAIEAMRGIAEASRRITDIIGVIDEIAFQTNLLALNAAVEAARAGDAGKGFAVVAQEVRVLAQRSAQASKEIKTLILASDGQVRNGVEMVRKAGDSLTGIVGGVKQVAVLISEMAVAAQEQATALDEINSAVASMDEMTQKNAALVEETTAAAQAMTGQAGDLQRLVGFFRIGGGGRGAGQRRPGRR